MEKVCEVGFLGDNVFHVSDLLAIRYETIFEIFGFFMKWKNIVSDLFHLDSHFWVYPFENSLFDVFGKVFYLLC